MTAIKDDTSALRHAVSILLCLDAQRRGVEPNAMALADHDRVMRQLSFEGGEELYEHLRTAMDIIGGLK